MLGQVATKLPVMVDTDGERPEAIATLEPVAQARAGHARDLGESATGGPSTGDAPSGRSSRVRPRASRSLPRDDTSDAQLIRIVEQAHGASGGTMIVVHPGPAGERPTLDRRWATLIEQAIAIHGDIRLALRIPGPAALR